MPLSSRIRVHLQSHVVGYLALFVALSGTALALPGQKQVKSDDIAKGAVKGKAIAANAVSAPKLQASSVDATKIVDGTITAGELGAGAVGATQLAPGAVGSTQLAPGAVIGEKIGQGEINGDKLANGAVDSSKVANETLLAEDLANGAVDSSKVANGALLAEDFAAGQISDGFAVSTTPNLSGTPFDLVFTNQTVPRSGRLFVTASLFAELNCLAACQFDLALYVDNTLVPNSTATLGASIPGGGGTERTQPTISGILPVTAGPHTIRLRGATTNANSLFDTNVSITGILLQ